ncbi:MAG: FAD-binding oxidoreductase [Candidatus Thermoplasmatota archaeon]|nr:FAD-binding oxidoreductase [Candidatus Thermoplasmatota archaeon]
MKYGPTVVVGAGVIGASTAYHLKRIDPRREVTLVDMNRRVGEGSTAKSAALYRNIFSSKASRLLSTSSIRYYLELGSRIQMDPTGYLWTFSEAQWRASRDAIDTLDPNRDEVEFLDVKGISDMLRIDPLARGPFPGISRAIHGRLCGSLSGMGLAQHYGDEFRRMGGEIVLNKRIDSIDLSGYTQRFAPWTDVRALSVTADDGERYGAEDLVIACGPWTNELLSGIGIFSGVLPKKRQLFGLRIDDPSQMIPGGDPLRVPAVILPAGGTYLKPMLDRKLVLVGLADDLGQPFGMGDPDPDPIYFERAIAPVMSHYFPALVDYGLKMKWAGYYSYHLPDKNPVVERVSNITWASGASGSGIMKADAIGRIAASRVLGERTTDLFDGSAIPTSAISLRDRAVQMERFVI